MQRVWREADLRPHRLARYMASTDPDFETKAADIIGLYLDPPRHAAVFCVDEKTAIQALDRRDRVLPLSPGRVERHGFEYKRNGTLSLYAALNIRTGKVHGKPTARHTSEDFVDFLGEVVATCDLARKLRRYIAACRTVHWFRVAFEQLDRLLYGVPLAIATSIAAKDTPMPVAEVGR